MLIRSAVVLSVLLAMTACTGSPDATPAATASEATQPAATSVVAPDTTAASNAAAAEASSEPSTEAATTPAPVAATSLPAATPDTAMPAGPAPVLGTDYFMIDTPDQETGRTISVVEVFNYRCPICAHFQPAVDAWRRTLPADVQFTTLPAAFGGPWDDFVLAYYAAEALGVRDRSHSEMFKVIHEQNTYTLDDIGAVYAKFGVDPKVFVAAMQSFAVKTKLAKARAQISVWGVEGIPTIIVAGKYRVKKTGSEEAFLHNVDWIIARERAARQQR